MIQRFHVAWYKSLDGLDVRLRPLTVLLGPNAAGKSNFLDALQLLSQFVNRRTLKEAFDPPCRGKPLEAFAFAREGVAGLLKMDAVRFAFEVDVELSQQTVEAVEQQIAEMRQKPGPATEDAKAREHVKERFLRYRLEVEMVPRTGVLRVADEYLAALRDNGQVKNSRNPFLEKTEGRLSLRLEGQAHPTYHEVGLDHALVSRPLYPPHYPHLVALRQELAGWHCFYFEPRERMRAPTPVKEVNTIGLMGEDLAAFLNSLKAKNPRQFAAIERAVRTLLPRIEHIEVEPNVLGEVELRLIEDGISVPARLVSEGTLRILGLLAIGAAGSAPTLVAMEEPENGIHPRRIQLIARFLQTRAEMGPTQFIVTTHSPLLADDLPCDSLFVVRRRGGRTMIDPYTELGPLFRGEQLARDLTEPGESDKATVSQRMMRGDFDAW
jgi:predicted ATPase